ncbi:MAG: GntR family transcriptional regulator [Spirochaetia bacterium]|nr:GntR family transcriptional regulator [Spirochaetia bacterium]
MKTTDNTEKSDPVEMNDLSVLEEKLVVEQGDSLPNVIRRRIANDILNERYSLGAKLDEKGLAEKYGVSRTPIREALRQLESACLVEIKPNKGAVVISPDKEYLQNLFETAAELESLCARFAAARMTMIERMHLQEIHKQAELAVENNDVEEYTIINRKFLSALVLGMHNPIMADVVKRCLVQTGPFRKKQFEIEGRLQASIKEHEQILEAIKDHDMAKAHKMMGAHVSEVFFAVLTHMNFIK